MTASLSAPTGRSAWLESWLRELPAPSGPLAAVQERGRQALAQQPVPSSRLEEWRFTDLSLLQELPLAPAAPAAAPLGTGLDSEVLRLQLDGSSDPFAGVTLPAGLQVLSDAELVQGLGHTLAATGCQDHWPVELNHAVASQVLALRLTSRSKLKLELHSAASAGLMPLRLLLILEEKAELELSHRLEAQSTGLTSLLVEAHLARSASLQHNLVALGSVDAALLGHLAIEQEPESQVALTTVTAGWGLARLEPRLVQVDGQATSTLRGLQLVGGKQIADTHSHVHFAGPEGQLDQLHKAVAAGQGRSVFNGAVQVPRAAQRTNAAQLSRNLLLSDRARIDTKPELEIVADDVKCAHGATVSSLQTDELFYLQSRGIDADQAAGLLKRAFCEEVLRELPAVARGWCPLEQWQLEQA
ncbi:SufB/SufD family protein [Vulcanococcus sp.]|jgi:FeS assembly protein SufD|uniref:SufB/SufD family protein n=1 Tax=Vulcanococcus sp. TaxID=2856995 RepID=UPI003C099D3A